MNYVIGVDIGTQSTKAVLVGEDGSIVASASREYAPDTPKPNWAEQDAEVWQKAFEQTVAEVAVVAPPDSVKAVAISSLYGGSGIPVDSDMTPLHPCLIWMDRRAEKQVQWVKDNVDLQWLGEITGNGCDSYYGFTKILWLRDERPEVWAKTALFLPPNAYVAYRLTGKVAVDHSSAGNVGGVYDIKKREWSSETLNALRIPISMMPEQLVASTDVVGGLTKEAASRIKLPEGTPIVAGGVDAAIACYSGGVVKPGQHVAMIGTSMCWGYIAPSTVAANGLVSMPYVVGEHLYIFGGAACAGASVAWFRDQCCQSEMAEAKSTGHDPHALMEESAALINPGSDGIVFLPYLMGERSPVWDPQASGAFIGLNLFHTKAHLYRAVLEGVTFALRHNMEAGATGSAPLESKLVVVGGAAKSNLWMQMISDITKYPVWTIAEEVEAAMGAARLAALGANLIRVTDADWITLTERAIPNVANTAAYDAAYSVYLTLYPTLRSSMHSLVALRGGIAESVPESYEPAATHPDSRVKTTTPNEEIPRSETDTVPNTPAKCVS
eukprot:Protomagalhaensia_sp_Gyna_25__5464@NODE_71_length_5627_cov_26_770401_g53_i0_p1_GENE_NODE_71_length_5627_cov_26_770401_g53_i0NODE_71_length_5627_cov_26_770401_g53_i0_p1_ORF_typecomplete_len563_score136_73FGGY_N/PF00370_21/7_1e66FGGY_C/PF02782_16/6_3e48BcrAD_BadFG/PF01869_20/0_00073BcrAD_BadFG/PF01869_20/4_4e03BcrAD_BadFG/PF01869_20/3_3ROK/PF00480_20/7_8e05ROK/PF00480_20/2_1e03Kelch_2/PF07646_15/4e02Kelch_2/PF07646_15/7_6Kelch_2/PF07646_15/46Kelch_6/PF13964_6/6_7e02Kelch_6/PF13964_6/1_4Kelch_6/PF1